MTWVAVAVAGAAVVGAVASNSAANKSADAAKAGIKSTNALSAQSRQDAINLFGQGRESAQLGIGSALNFYKDNAQQRNQPLIQGNMMAQQAIGQGGIQANNAILGLPVDMSFANNPQQVSADYTNINSAQLPVLGMSFADQEAARAAAAQPGIDAANAEKARAAAKAAEAQKRSLYDGSTGGLTMAAFDKNRLKFDNVLGNPLGISEKYNDKINPTKKLKKVLKKLF
jgi:hypothetical protein